MKPKSLIPILCCLFISLSMHALDAMRQPTDKFQTQLEMEQGFRHDQLKWSTSGFHKKPNILSELDFKHIKLYMSNIKWIASNTTYKGELNLGFGNVITGTCQDSDYLRNDRKGEFSRSISKISGSYNIDNSLTFGQIFSFNGGTSLTASLGYVIYLQKYTICDGYQTIAETYFSPKKQHKIVGLKSSYKARWSAPCIDFVLTVPILPEVHINIGYTMYYPVIYQGYGYWNLRKYPGPHYTQKARKSKSYGKKCKCGLSYTCSRKFELGCTLRAMSLTAHDGFDRWTHSIKAPFRKVQRISIDYIFTASYSF